MGKRGIWLIISVFFLLILSPVYSQSQTNPLDPWNPANYEPGVVLVKFKQGIDLNSAELQNLLEDVGATSYERTLPNIEPPESEYVTKEVLNRRSNIYHCQQNKLEALQHLLDALNKAYSRTKSFIAKQILAAMIDFLHLEIKSAEREVKNARRSLRAPIGGKIPDLTKLYTLTLPENANIPWVCDRLIKSGTVNYAEPNYYLVFQGIYTPNDPLYPDQQSLALTNVEGAWNLFPTESDIGKGIIVAMFDDNFDYTHPDFGFEDHNLNNQLDPGEDLNSNGILDRGNVWVNEFECPTPDPLGQCTDLVDDFPPEGYLNDYIGWDWTLNSRDVFAPDGPSHGTATSSIVGAVDNNGIGIAGIARNSKIMFLKPTTVTETAQAIIDYAMFHGADVVSMSFICPDPRSQINDFIDTATNVYGMIFVGGAGNSNNNHLQQSPTDNPNVISAAAIGLNNVREPYSSFGPGIDAAAPVPVKAFSLPPLEYIDFNGTSAATPQISSLVALYLSFHANDKLPSGTPNPVSLDDIRQVIRQSSTDIVDPLGKSENRVGWDIYTGYGRINMGQALQTPNPTCVAKFENMPLIDPVTGEYIKLSGTKLIKGWAESFLNAPSTFAYNIQMGRGLEPNAGSWTDLQGCSGNTQVQGQGNSPGTFCTLNSDSLPEGMISLLLKVQDDTGTCEVRTVFIVDNIQIADPPNGLPTNDFVNISGSAKQPITSYALYWGLGMNPTSSSWNSSGFTYNSATVIDATFDTSLIPDREEYTIKAVVNLAGISGSEEFVRLNKDNSLQAGWPRILSQPIYSFLRVSDLDNDGNLEIIVKSDFTRSVPETGNQPMLYVLDSQGNDKWNWPVPIFDRPDEAYVQSESHNSRFAIGDINNDGFKEIVYIEPNRDTHSSLIRFYAYDGTVLWELPDIFTHLVNVPILYDIDADSELEIITYGVDSSSTAMVKVFNYDGTLYDEWVVQGPFIEPFTNFRKGFAVSDIDDNGAVEVVCAINNEIYLYYINPLTPGADILPGWPVTGPNSWFDAYLYSSNISLADIDFNGYKEIIISDKNLMYVFNYDGSNHFGWPLPLDILNIIYETKILQPFDDSWPRLVAFESLYLHSWNNDGTSENKENIFAKFGDLLHHYQLGDIDNDGIKEYFLSGSYGIDYENSPFPEPSYRFIEERVNDAISLTSKSASINVEGSINEVPQKHFGFGTNSVYESSEPFIIDIDNDGKLEIITANGFNDTNQSYSNSHLSWFYNAGAVMVRKTDSPAPIGNEQRSQWRGNERNTGEFALDMPSNPPDIIPPTISDMTVLNECNPVSPWDISADIWDDNQLPAAPTVIYFIDGVEQPAIPMTGPFPQNGNYYATIPEFSVSHRIEYYIRVVDIGENIAESVHMAFFHDFLPPVIVSVTDVPDSNSNIGPYPITIDVDEDLPPLSLAKVTYYINYASGFYDTGLVLLTQGPAMHYKGLLPPLLGAGTVTYTTYVMDQACNNDSVTKSFIYDPEGPSVSLIENPTCRYTGSTTICTGPYWVKASVTDWTFIEDVNISYNVDGVAGSAPMNRVGAYYEYLIDFTTSNGSTVNFTITAQDSLGNTTTSSHYLSVDTIDNIFPIVDLGVVSGFYQPPFSFTPTVVEDNLDNSISSVVVTHFPPFNFGDTITLFIDDIFTVTGTATDLAGNTTTETVENIVIDGTPPIISIAGVANDGYYNTDVTPVITATDNNVVTLSATLNEATYTIGMPIIEEGTYGLLVNAYDQAGNTSRETRNFRIDKTPPTIISTTDLPDTTIESGSYYIRTVLTDNDGWDLNEPVVIYESIDGGSWLGPLNFSFINQVEPRVYEVTFEIPALSAPTDICYFIKAKDRSGNESTDPATTPESNPYCFSVVYPFTPGSLFAAANLVPPLNVYELNFRTGKMSTFVDLCHFGECNKQIVGIMGFAFDISSDKIYFTLDYYEPDDPTPYHALARFDAAGNIEFVTSSQTIQFATFASDIAALFDTAPFIAVSSYEVNNVSQAYLIGINEDGTMFSIFSDPQPFIPSGLGYSLEITEQALFVPGYLPNDPSISYLFRVLPGNPPTWDAIPIPPAIGSIEATAYDRVKDKLYIYAKLHEDIGELNPSPYTDMDYRIYSIPADPGIPPNLVTFDEYATFINLDQSWPAEIEYNIAEGYVIYAQHKHVLEGTLYGGWTLYRVDNGDVENRFSTTPPVSRQDVLSRGPIPTGSLQYLTGPIGDIQVTSIPSDPSTVLSKLKDDIIQFDPSRTNIPITQLNDYLNNAINYYSVKDYTDSVAELGLFQSLIITLYGDGYLKEKEYEHFMDWSDVVISVCLRQAP